MPQQTISAPTCEEDETGEGILLIEVFFLIDLHPVQQGVFYFLPLFIVWFYNKIRKELQRWGLEIL